MGKAGKRAAKAAAKAGQPAPEGEEPAGQTEELSWRSGYLVIPVPRWGKAGGSGSGRRAVALPLRPLLLLIFWFIWIHWR